LAHPGGIKSAQNQRRTIFVQPALQTTDRRAPRSTNFLTWLARPRAQQSLRARGFFEMNCLIDIGIEHSTAPKVIRQAVAPRQHVARVQTSTNSRFLNTKLGQCRGQQKAHKGASELFTSQAKLPSHGDAQSVSELSTRDTRRKIEGNLCKGKKRSQARFAHRFACGLVPPNHLHEDEKTITSRWVQ